MVFVIGFKEGRGFILWKDSIYFVYVYINILVLVEYYKFLKNN